MNNKILKGISLIIFGILLCVGGTEINYTIPSNLSELPFSLIGVIFGIAGLAMVFTKESKDTDK